MNIEKLKAFKISLKSPYTGMTKELMNRIEGIKVDDKVDLDLNKDGKINKEDASIAGKVLQKNKQKVK